MTYNNFYQRLRIKCVQIFDSMYYEKENHSKCHKRNWERMGRFIFGISYETYLSYLKMDTSDIPPIPNETVSMLQVLIDELLARDPSNGKTSSRDNKSRVDQILRSIGTNEQTCDTPASRQK